jgi:Zn-dependent protease with chaperone function
MSAPPTSSSHARTFVKVLVLPALTFFLVPLVTAGFASYGQGELDEMILQSIGRSIDADATLDAAEREANRAFFAAHPASAICADPDPAPNLAGYREAVCKAFGDVWQFRAARRAGWAAAFVGAATLFAIGLLGLLAYARPRAQYGTFMVGWRLVQLVAAVETAVQGALLVWLSYWSTALLFERYYPKLIVIAAVLAGVAVWVILAALFRRPSASAPLEAAAVTPADAPTLWRRLEELAVRLGTEPPRVMAAGIDDNFFVTEAPLPLADGTAGEGRLLYVSLPLLRTLSVSEAEAVLAHELAHFKSGDTAASAKLGPALARYETYSEALFEGGLTVPAALVMRLYRAVFELALSKERRRRELAADAEAARLTSPDDLGRSLLKVAGYSDFRARTEQALFEQRGVHQGELAIQARIEAGLATHAASAAFLDQLSTLRVPHPFDSHPPLGDRLRSAGCTVRVTDAGGLLQAAPTASWIDAILTAGGIEERLWGAYEARFKASHEASLAWRYLPATEEERALVLKHFPGRTFPTKKGAVRLTYQDLTAEDGTVVPLADITSATVENGNFTNNLVLTVLGGTKFKLKLGPLGKEREPFKSAFGQYWQRSQVARQQSR